MLKVYRVIDKTEFINQYKKFVNGKSNFIEFTDITRVFIAEEWAKMYFK
jgi:hypothetical protein